MNARARALQLLDGQEQRAFCMRYSNIVSIDSWVFKRER